MAVQLQRKWKERESSTTTSPERTKVWCEPSHNKLKANNTNNVEKRVVVPVVYYLSRNGQLEHPHFMEVPLSCPQGLYLRDVINRLSLLRGKSMASQYSWSSKRSYKNGYVWHDLDENDYIHPVHGSEYVLKGSEIPIETETSSSCSAKTVHSSETTTSDIAPARTRRRNQSWTAIDLHHHDEYKVYKSAESTREFAGKSALSDASTQTDDKRRRSRGRVEEAIAEVEERDREERLSRDEIEISPPTSDSSPETLESLMKTDGRLVLATTTPSTSSSSQGVRLGDESSNRTAGHCPSGRIKASSVLMSLISCGSISFRDCGATAVKDHGFSLISHYKTRLPRGDNETVGDANDHDVMMEIERNASSSFAKMALEDKEYFSGSLIETNKKDEFLPASLKRSSSYNADRSSHLRLESKEEDGVRAKCIPRRPRTQPSKKEFDAEISRVTSSSTTDRNKN